MDEAARYDGGPSLDCSGDVWQGHYPGLGTVRVHPDGSLDVEAIPAEPSARDADEDLRLREDALRHGWGETLSFVRRGFRIADAAAVTPPTDPSRCLLIRGANHDMGAVTLALIMRGWLAINDGLTPTRFDEGALVAWPKQAPLIFHRNRLRRVGLEGTPARLHTDAMQVDLPRVDEPRTVAAVCHVTVRRPDSQALEPITGQRRLAASSSLMLNMAPVSDEADPASSTPEEQSPDLAAQMLAEHLQIAALPFVELRVGRKTIEQDAQALENWWRTVTST